MTVTNEIKKLENAFDRINEHFFEGKLHRPVIHFYPDRSKKAMGWMTIGKIWVDGQTAEREINISANYADSDEMVYTTLMHEMVHLYCIENNIKDTSNNNFYHNKNFKKIGEKLGLVFETKPETYGWIEKTINDETRNFIKTLEPIIVKVETSKALAKVEEEDEEEENNDPPKRKGSYKHVCPVCGAIARTTKNTVHLMCADCMVKMEIED